MVILCGRLVQVFNSNFEEYIPTASQIINHLIQMQSTLLKIFESNTNLCLSELISSIFGTLSLFINWLVNFRKWISESKTDQIGNSDSLITYLIDLCIISSSNQVTYNLFNC